MKKYIVPEQKVITIDAASMLAESLEGGGENKMRGSLGSGETGGGGRAKEEAGWASGW